MAISKVIFNSVTQMDVTDTTAEDTDVASGKYFYGADGVKTAGTGSGPISVQSNKAYTVSGSGSTNISPDTGYEAMDAVALTVPAQTLPTSTGASATSGYTQKAAVAHSASDQYINIPSGFNDAGAYYKINAVNIESLSVTPTESEQTFSAHGETQVAQTYSWGRGIAGLNPALQAGTEYSYLYEYATESMTNNNQYYSRTGTFTCSAELTQIESSPSVSVSSTSVYFSSTDYDYYRITFYSLPVDGYSPVVVSAISSTYVGSGITSRSSSDLTASGATVTAPAGYYSSSASKSVASGSATGPSSLSGSSATVSTGTNTITLTKTGVTTTPTVSAGYVSSATASTATVALTASVTTKAATTYNTSSSDQTISSGTYLTGTQTIKAVTVSGLSANTILSGTTVKIGDANDDDRIASVSGSVSFQTYYTGSSTPSSSLGVNGDIYLQTS